jgi:hypothetical protein
LRNKYAKKGYKACLAGQTKADNPYTLDEEIWKLLKKRTFWIMGFEDADYSKTMRHRRKKQSEKEIRKYDKEQKRKHKVVKDKKHGHKSKHSSK